MTGLNSLRQLVFKELEMHMRRLIHLDVGSAVNTYAGEQQHGVANCACGHGVTHAPLSLAVEDDCWASELCVRW